MRTYLHTTSGSAENPDGDVSRMASIDPAERCSWSCFAGTTGNRGRLRWAALALPLLLCACQTTGGKDTIAQLRTTRIEIKDERIENVPEKAMESYRRFLEDTPKSPLKPEATRRLADLKAEQNYERLTDAAEERRAQAVLEARHMQAAAAPAQEQPAAEQPVPEQPAPAQAAPVRPEPAQPKPERAARPEAAPTPRPTASAPAAPAPEAKQADGSQAELEKRAAQTRPPAYAPPEKGLVEGAGDLEGVGALEAIELYTKLLKEYPSYERSDQVLYQMSRAYEELGRIDDAIQVLGQLALEFPKSRYADEAQFRRGEFFFTRRRYLEAEEAYGSIVAMGASSSYYQLALYKMGWVFYKQDLYDKALDRFIALLDHKVATGYDFAQTGDVAERKRMDDTFRVISLSFSNLGGPDAAVEYFNRRGRRSFEDAVFSSLAEFYFEKRRYGDAVATYNTFIDKNPYHKASPRFLMRVIEIQLAGGFPSLAIDAKKKFVHLYGVKEEYWRQLNGSSRPDVVAWLKENLTDLAKHYHALYQSPKQDKDKQKNFEEALRWYREYIDSFPEDTDTPGVNYLMADLYLENRSFDLAAGEYEKTSYRYPSHERSPAAGYAAVYAWRQYLAGVSPDAKTQVMKEVVRSSLQFAAAYPGHEKAAIVMGAAVDDLYVMREYGQAASASRTLVERFPRADAELLQRTWLVNGHANYELLRYADAEAAYTKLLELLPPDDKTRGDLTDFLASAIYKQGEQANAQKEYEAAAQHFLRVGKLAPASKIRVNAEYDAAAALIEIKQWSRAVTVLDRFRKLFPGHALQPEVTRKLAYAYRESGKLALAADEYERVADEWTDDDVRREALLTAAELHERSGNQDRALAAYRRYVDGFPHPAEANLEARAKIAEVLKKKNDQAGYLEELGQIVAVDANAGTERTPRTRFLAAQAGLVLAQRAFGRFDEVKLVEPFEANLAKKKELMKAATQQLNSLIDYGIGDITAAAAYYLAEIYAGFSRDLKGSERPQGLSPLEREEYDLALEEQAYPFEEKAIATYQSNLELVVRGVYNEWTEKSLQRLARLVPARYDKPEEESPVIATLDRYVYAVGQPETPANKPAAAAPAQSGEAKQTAPRDEGKEAAPDEALKQEQKPADAKEAVKAEQPKQDAKPAQARGSQKAGAKKTEKPAKTKKADKTVKSKKAAKPAAADAGAQPAATP